MNTSESSHFKQVILSMNVFLIIEQLIISTRQHALLFTVTL